jgi:hypothetical protein
MLRVIREQEPTRPRAKLSTFGGYNLRPLEIPVSAKVQLPGQGQRPRAQVEEERAGLAEDGTAENPADASATTTVARSGS